MKKTLVNTSLFLLGLLTLSTGFGQEKHKEWSEPKFKKSKSYSKSYSLSGNDKINLSNQFGEMKIMTWEKNEVKDDISITGKSDNSEARAQEIIDRITISDSKSGNTVSFKTNFEDRKNDKSDKGEHRNEGMEVNWAVYLPAGNALDAENQFGKLIVPDLRGEATLSSKFGSLTAGKISNAKEVNVEFGSADIAHIHGGQLTIKFSSGTVKKLSGDVKSNLEFSQVKLDLDNDLSLEFEGGNSVYFARKFLMGSSRCFQQVEVDLQFTPARTLIEKNVHGGTFVD